MELGLYTFAETTADPRTGRTISSAERLRDLMEEIELADQVGLEVFGVGEHHRPDYAVSAPAVVLAAAAQRTLGINAHGYLADDSRQAADEFFPSYAEVMTRIGRERGWPPPTRSEPGSLPWCGARRRGARSRRTS